jgi:hypothetical protein
MVRYPARSIEGFVLYSFVVSNCVLCSLNCLCKLYDQLWAARRNVGQLKFKLSNYDFREFDADQPSLYN